MTTRYLRGDKVDEILARINGTTPRWYLTDHQGSIRTIIDNDGVVKDAITYDAFGNILSETNSAERGRYAWTSREIDVEIAMQYNRARYYDASTGRWITQDPLGYDAGDSNLYRYVNNRPTMTTDPSGTIVSYLTDHANFLGDDTKAFIRGADFLRTGIGAAIVQPIEVGKRDGVGSGVLSFLDAAAGMLPYVGRAYGAAKDIRHAINNGDSGLSSVAQGVFRNLPVTSAIWMGVEAYHGVNIGGANDGKILTSEEAHQRTGSAVIDAVLTLTGVRIGSKKGAARQNNAVGGAPAAPAVVGGAPAAGFLRKQNGGAPAVPAVVGGAPAAAGAVPNKVPALIGVVIHAAKAPLLVPPEPLQGRLLGNRLENGRIRLLEEPDPALAALVNYQQQFQNALERIREKMQKIEGDCPCSNIFYGQLDQHDRATWGLAFLQQKDTGQDRAELNLFGETARWNALPPPTRWDRGHLIAARFGGKGGSIVTNNEAKRNFIPQPLVVNRGPMDQMEDYVNNEAQTKCVIYCVCLAPACWFTRRGGRGCR